MKIESSAEKKAKEILLKDNYEFLTDVIKKLRNEKIEPLREVITELVFVTGFCSLK